jgi:CsoR family transcriptional regulator, copper-sensing transcriptional repressor
MHSSSGSSSGRFDHPTLDQDAEQRRRVINRLKRLEGQVRGLQGMIEEGRSCREVLTLLAGIRSALNATGDVILENYAQGCLTDAASADEALHDLVQAVRLARG